MPLPPIPLRVAAATASSALLLVGCAGTDGAEESTSASPPATALTEASAVAHLYRSPTCQCCGEHAEHLRDAGFEVVEHEVGDITEVKDELDVPEQVRSCHTTVVDGYVIEGHVPADDIDRLLAERPEVTGIGLAGMPQGAPGMPGELTESLDVRAFSDGQDAGPAQ